MQRKALLYIFTAAAFFGLVLGAWFFANELRLKILEGPSKDQFSLEEGQKGVSLNPSFSNKATPEKSVQNPPPLPAGQGQQTVSAPETKPEANTPPPTEKTQEDTSSFSFAIIGDTQSFDFDKTDGGLQQAVKNITSKNVDVVINEGDMLGSCGGDDKCERGLTRWKETLSTLYSKTYEMMGNHDRTGKAKSDALWQKFFDLPTNGPEGYKELVYSFDFQNSHFVVLNSEKPSEHAVDKNQRDWLEQDLTNNKKDTTFVFFHEPAYPVKHKISSSLDAKPEERDALWKILKEHSVNAVFNGHEHIVSRRAVDGVYQFVFGNTDSYDHELPEAGVAEYSYQGNAFGLVEVTGKKITVSTYSVNGNELNSFELPVK
jgi:3',5'-cyclic AMP phosphodiesterase CpdA